ncbi:hypothetical protein MMC09_006620 [Bachmanniomyces sp. S44760]|nr:hypothetical protein [Bachmanniomyces sp. S44760]
MLQLLHRHGVLRALRGHSTSRSPLNLHCSSKLTISKAALNFTSHPLERSLNTDAETSKSQLENYGNTTDRHIPQEDTVLQDEAYLEPSNGGHSVHAPDNFNEEDRQVLQEALRDQDPHRLLQIILPAYKDPNHLNLGSLPASLFVEILRLLSPEFLVKPYTDLHRDIHPHMISHRNDGTRQLEEALGEYVNVIWGFIEQRRLAGRGIGITEYNSMLTVAEATGDGGLAKQIWGAMQRDAIQPDTLSFNKYFKARCWHNVHDLAEREKFRFRSYYWAMRLPVKLGMERKIGFRGYQTGDSGLRNEIIKAFDAMVRRGIPSNTETLVTLMTAMAREGDIPGVKSILTRMWDIDVDAIVGLGEVQIPQQIGTSPQSPIYPTEELLFTVAHIFGSNNQLPTALRIVDYISRKYNVSIDLKTWAELLEWTYVLSRKRYGPLRKNSDQTAGTLPEASVASIWDTMTSEPYQQTPTMPMRNRYVVSLIRREMLSESWAAMREGRKQYNQKRASVKNNRVIQADLQAKHKLSGTSSPREVDPGWERHAELADLEAYRDFVMICRWVRLLLVSDRCMSDSLEWQRVNVPKIIEEWWYFRLRNGSRIRSGFRYKISSGHIWIAPTLRKTAVQRIPSHLPGIDLVWQPDQVVLNDEDKPVTITEGETESFDEEDLEEKDVPHAIRTE